MPDNTNATNPSEDTPVESRPWMKNYAWSQMSEPEIRSVLAELDGIAQTRQWNGIPVNLRELKEVEAQRDEGQLGLAQLQELQEDWEGMEMEEAEEHGSEEGLELGVPEEEHESHDIHLYALVINDLKRRGLLHVEEIYGPLLCSFGWHIFNLVNSDCKHTCQTPYLESPRGYRRCPRFFDPKIPSHSFRYDYGTSGNDRLAVLFVGRSNTGKSFSFKALVDDASAYLINPLNPIFPVVGATRFTSAGLFGSYSYAREREAKEESSKKSKKSKKKKDEDEPISDAEFLAQFSNPPPPTATPGPEAVPLRVIPSPSPLVPGVVYGDTHDKCDGILYLSEFASISDQGAQDHNRNLLNEILEFLSSGRMRVRLRDGEMTHVSRMTVWGGIQPERLDLVAGLFRRFAYIYIDYTEEEERIRVQQMLTASTLPPRAEGYERSREIAADLYQGFDATHLRLSPAFTSFIEEQMNRPENALQSDDVHILYQMAVGYAVVAQWEKGDGVLVVEMDESLRRLLLRQIENRRRVAIAGSTIGQRMLLWDHLRRDIAAHGPMPLEDIRLRLVRSTSLAADTVETHLLYLRGKDVKGLPLRGVTSVLVRTTKTRDGKPLYGLRAGEIPEEEEVGRRPLRHR